jgi:uncharacterized protein YkwD
VAADSGEVGGRRIRIGTLAALAVTLTLAVGVAAGTAAEPAPARSLTAVNTLEAQVLVELNAVRRKHGLVPLKVSKPLGVAADAHSKAMGAHGFFDHDSRDGTEFWQRVRRYYGPAGFRSWSVGENLLWSSGSLDAKSAVRMWMNSPGHRKNILTARWREIGLGAVAVRSAPGVYGGRDVVIITTDFGFRS